MAVINNKIENISALTPMQEGMLFHNQISSESSAYVIQFVLNVEKLLRPDIIKDALDLLSRKYSVIRTFFVSEKVENPCQVVLRERVPEFAEYDLSGKDSAEKETARL